jgi:hypothetical protein
MRLSSSVGVACAAKRDLSAEMRGPRPTDLATFEQPPPLGIRPNEPVGLTGQFGTHPPQEVRFLSASSRLSDQEPTVSAGCSSWNSTAADRPDVRCHMSYLSGAQHRRAAHPLGLSVRGASSPASVLGHVNQQVVAAVA